MAGATLERVQAWRPALPGVTEVFHARFVGHRYPPHSHDSWAVIVIDDGAIRYDLEHHHRGADATTVAVLPPHITHDGRAATGAGFAKRVLYLDTGLLPANLIGHGVDRSEIADLALRNVISLLHHSLRSREEALDGEERLERVVGRLRSHLGAAPATAPPPVRDDAGQLRDYLVARAHEPVNLADASAALGRSVAHLARSFRAAFAISPHAFVIGLRVERARGLLLAGWPPALAAITAGFYDQAHLHRHFRSHTGTTPGRFARVAT